MLLSGKNDIDDLVITDCDVMIYHPMENDDIWRVEVIQNILEERENKALANEDVDMQADLEFVTDVTDISA